MKSVSLVSFVGDRTADLPAQQQPLLSPIARSDSKTHRRKATGLLMSSESLLKNLGVFLFNFLVVIYELFMKFTHPEGG